MFYSVYKAIKGDVTMHRNLMVQAFIKSLDGAGTIRTVGMVQTLLGVGPVFCQCEYLQVGGYCDWTYSWRLLLAYSLQMFQVGLYVKLSKSNQCIHQFIQDLYQYAMFCSVVIVSFLVGSNQNQTVYTLSVIYTISIIYARNKRFLGPYWIKVPSALNDAFFSFCSVILIDDMMSFQTFKSKRMDRFNDNGPDDNQKQKKDTIEPAMENGAGWKSFVYTLLFLGLLLGAIYSSVVLHKNENETMYSMNLVETDVSSDINGHKYRFNHSRISNLSLIPICHDEENAAVTEICVTKTVIYSSINNFHYILTK